MAKPVYVTTPIYYVNDVPHIGHAYTTIAADLLVRFYKLDGREAFFLTGTDEHGDKVARTARAAGMTPKEYCDGIVNKFIAAWERLDISYDYFIRTTDERHAQGVRKILEAMLKAKTDDGRDVVYSDYYEGLYCTGCEKFITEKELVDGLCPDHKKPPEKIKEKNYFFRLTAFVDKIKAKIESGELRIMPEERRREVLGLINQDLPDFSLSRERVEWGISLPFDETQVAYVWVDALSNYITAIGYEDAAATFEKWWQGGEIIQLMAKDILKFHCLYWPAMLMAAGLKTPETLFLHGFFTVDGEKMSKSLGNQIFPEDMVEQFGADGTRYLLLTQYPFGVDGDIQAKRFVQQYNSDLANDLGNLVSRVVKMVQVNFDGAVPKACEGIDGLDELRANAEKLADTVYDHVQQLRLTHAIGDAMALVKQANKFFADTTPWILAREGKTEPLGGILNACLETIRIVSIIMYPVMPTKMTELRQVLGLGDDTLTLEQARMFHGLKAGDKVTLEDAVFPRLDTKKAKESKESKQPSGKKAESDDQPVEGLIAIDDFGKVQLRVAEVLEASRVDGADRLLRLKIDVGNDQRQIVAGIAEHYTPEEITGKKIIVVANLQPATIRGLDSHGMLLAAKKGKKLSVVTVDRDLPPGAKIS